MKQAELPLIYYDQVIEKGMSDNNAVLHNTVLHNTTLGSLSELSLCFTNNYSPTSILVSVLFDHNLSYS